MTTSERPFRKRRSSEQDARLVDAVVVPRFAAHFARLLLAEVPADARNVLDVGCGTGHVSFHVLSRIGPSGRVVAVDRDAGLVDLARRRGWEEIGKRLFFKVETAESLSFGDGVFDVVVGNLLYPELTDHQRALAELRRVLTPGGRLLLTTPLRGTFGEVFDVLHERADHLGDEALRQRARVVEARQPTVASLDAALTNAGFEEIEVRHETFRLSFRSAAELFADRLVRLVAMPDWREVVGDDGQAHLQAVERALDTYFAGGPLSLTVDAGC
ncbi:MAG: methyltransferase domain-containing protein, partial [Myxococcales bacterium]|nr:methyltransferase domain-containing protein [Myxococcales bacterium]